MSGVGTPADDLSTSVIRLQINMRETSVRELSRWKGVSTVPAAASVGWPMLLVGGGRGVNVSKIQNSWWRREGVGVKFFKNPNPGGGERGWE